MQKPPIDRMIRDYIRVCGKCGHHEKYDVFGKADRQRCGKCDEWLPFKVSKRGVE
jgi:ribosomal protein S27AE